MRSLLKKQKKTKKTLWDLYDEIQKINMWLEQHVYVTSENLQ